MKFIITTATDDDTKRIWLDLDGADVNVVVDDEIIAWISPDGEFHVHRADMSNVGIWFEEKGG